MESRRFESEGNEFNFSDAGRRNLSPSKTGGEISIANLRVEHV
jgi:hypothetical protein